MERLMHKQFLTVIYKKYKIDKWKRGGVLLIENMYEINAPGSVRIKTFV